MHSQTNAKPTIIKKEIKTGQGIDIIDHFDPNNPNPHPYSVKSDTRVFYDNKFYPLDFLKKIDKNNIEEIHIINIPDSISKDLRGIIYVRKKKK